MSLHVHLDLCARIKLFNLSDENFSLAIVLSLFLIFHFLGKYQPGSSFIKFVLIKKNRVYGEGYANWVVKLETVRYYLSVTVFDITC